MYCKIEPKKPAEINCCNIVQQTSFWAGVKEQQGIKPVNFEYAATDDLLHPRWLPDHHATGDLLVLISQIDQEQAVAIRFFHHPLNSNPAWFCKSVNCEKIFLS